MRLLEENKENPIVKYRTNRQTKKFDCSYFGNPLEEETTFKEEGDIEEDEIPFSIKREKSH
jgi:hypothetical protein